MSTPGELRIRRLRPDARLPERQHDGDAGLDLFACEPVVLEPGGGRAIVGTGIAVEVPEGWTALVCPRSGLAARHGVGVLNAPGIIDAGYRGELRVVLYNADPSEPFEVAAGDRVAQLVLAGVALPAVVEVSELTSAARGAAGFGSTGGFG